MPISNTPSSAARPASGSSTQGCTPYDVAATAIVPAPHGAPRLDAEKLVVYHLTLELHVLCADLVPASHRVLRDQLERASLSVLLNLSEGAGRHSRKDKRRHYAIARGSAMETAAAVDVVRARFLAPQAHCVVARSLALRVVQMLSKLDASLA